MVLFTSKMDVDSIFKVFKEIVIDIFFLSYILLYWFSCFCENFVKSGDNYLLLGGGR